MPFQEENGRGQELAAPGSAARSGRLRARGRRCGLARALRAAPLRAAALLALALVVLTDTAAAEPPARRGADVLLAAGTAGDSEQVASQLANVGRLLESSSGAQRVLASDNELARKIRLSAIERHRAAESAFRAGDSAAARELLDEAAKTMFQAIRVLGPAAEVTQKKIADFDGRAESTRVLLEALQRIAREEGTQGPAARTVAGVEKTVAAARELLAAGRHDEARKLLDGGYEIAKAAVEGLRDGKTLVRTLTFASDEEEYRYELDRNDTHQMLVRVVVGEKQPGAQAGALVDQAVQRAGELRRQAEQRAGGGAFRDAVRLLEQSTTELVRAIRSAGLYIPG